MTYSVDIIAGNQAIVTIRPVNADSAGDILKLMDKAEYYDINKGQYQPCAIEIKPFIT